MPCSTMPRSRLAVTCGSFCRSEPAAALRGLANAALPLGDQCSFSARSPRPAKNTSPRTSNSSGRERRSPVSRSGTDRDGPHVGGDVLARSAVAAGRRPDQPTLLVDQVDGEAVDLELAQKPDCVDPRLARARGSPAPPSGPAPRRRTRCRGSSCLTEVLDRGERRSRPLRRPSGSESRVCAVPGTAPPAPAARAWRRSKSASRQRRRVEHVVAPARVLDPLAQLAWRSRAVASGSAWGAGESSGRSMSSATTAP